jgi:hypothetical protein
MIRFSPEELAASGIADKVAIARCDLPAHRHHVRSAFDGEAFE